MTVTLVAQIVVRVCVLVEKIGFGI